MLTAHLPSGYVLGKSLPWPGRWVMPVALLGAVLPDLDLLFFYFVDGQRIHHHRYWVHIPAFWALVAALSLPILAWRGWLRPGVVFFVAIAVHLLLDSVSGGILWAAPFDTRLYSLVTVPATQGHWILSFLLHWTFLFELLIWAIAAYLFVKRVPPQPEAQI